MPDDPMLPPPDPGDVGKLLERFRRELLRKERAAASEMVRVYGEAWQRIQGELKQLDAEYQNMKSLGVQPGTDWIYQFNRARAFRDQVEGELNQFAQYAEKSTREQMREAISAADDHAETLTRKAAKKATAGISFNWNHVPTDAIAAMVGLTQTDSPLHRLFVSISAEGTQAAEDALINGLLMGYNPRKTAPLVKKALGVNLSRALQISRTETLRAYREATRQHYQANEDVLDGWIWSSACDGRTCASCWAMHGTKHGLNERLDDHPNGRCAMIPSLRNEDLDFGIEPGEKAFERLSDTEQLNVLGPAKFAAYKDGEIKLTDLVGRKYSKEWGWTRSEKSLKDVIGTDAAKAYTRLALMGTAKNAGNYSADDLIKVAGLGLRELSPQELSKVVQHVAQAGFDPQGSERCGGRLAGLVWNGKILKGSDMLPPGEVHYLRHVVTQKEWAESTTLAGYYQNLEQVIRDQSSRILISKFGGEWQVGFLGENKPGTQYTYTWIDYRVSRHHWITGLQIVDWEKFLRESKRTNLKWLR